MCGRLDGYLEAFAGLDTSLGREGTLRGEVYTGEYQSLLLLAVLDLIDSGYIKRNFISPDQKLEATFTTFLSKVAPGCASINMAVPFQGLQGSGFWQLVPSNPQSQHPQQVQLICKLRELYLGAKLADDLYPLLLMPGSRNKLRNVLLQTYLKGAPK